MAHVEDDGEQAIQNAEMLVQTLRRGDPAIPELTLEQIDQQLALAVDRVMAESSLYDRELAALAIKQAWGDVVEAIVLLRTYRTTLPRFYDSQPLNTSQMHIRRRISAIAKDSPGGQYLGPTVDYSHRVLDFNLMAATVSPTPELEPFHETTSCLLPRLNWTEHPAPTNTAQQGSDLTSSASMHVAEREARLQNLARADEGFLLALGHSTQRGYGNFHSFLGELCMGEVDVVICPEELGFDVAIANLTITEVQLVNPFQANGMPSQQLDGYGLTFGYNERKSLSMALVDRAMRAEELGEPVQYPAQDVEFVLSHSDNVDAQGVVQHLKLTHYVNVQAELNLMYQMQHGQNQAPPAQQPFQEM